MDVQVKSRCLGYLSLVALAVSMAGCGLLGLGGKKGGGDQGELVGVPNREGWVMTIPFGMVPIPAGTFHMGQADEDPASTQINFNKQVTIGPCERYLRVLEPYQKEWSSPNLRG